MGGVFAGYATIAALIALGVLLAHLRVIDAAGQRTLSTLAFYVASPALLLTVLQDSDLGAVFSGALLATTAAVLLTGAVYVVVAVLRRQRLGDAVIGALCSAYVNAGNLGLPIAAYVLGDPALVAPTLLLQLLVLQPLALTLLDVDGTATLSVRRVLSRPARNPITVASALGLGFALTGLELPAAVADPLTLVGGMAVPSMLLAYGVSLRLGPLPGRGVPPRELAGVVGLKLVVQPLLAYAVGRFALDLGTAELLAVTVLAALPTAQNVFVIASRYERRAVLARDAIFVSTVLSVPAVVVVTALVV
ncbi:AEC family transporter [Nocardioides sp. SOB77]|uniref:AEC family transporter n=1 Tax=Nocardioides oceani TaxID=3058369 RepID=A0ABT8FIT1_9ACTN|nr:AEC family transporter [Nocardioides oceani]MDN4174057.1 AEC family transporter [Nocardioides oceani]